jgi:hypothetical protein
MDKLEIKQGSFIQQTQYFIPVEIDLSRRTDTYRNLIFSLVPSDNHNTKSTCPTSVFTGYTMGMDFTLPWVGASLYHG